MRTNRPTSTARLALLLGMITAGVILAVGSLALGLPALQGSLAAVTPPTLCASYYEDVDALPVDGDSWTLPAASLRPGRREDAATD
jgi:hypothetical protein